MTLYDIYSEINKQQKKWNYYKKSYINNILPENEKAIDIIKKYMDAGNKTELYKDMDDKINCFDNIRANHIISTFLLGIHFYDKLQLESVFSDKMDIKNYHDWLFMWYLTCLYHDIGYVFEDNYKKVKTKELKDFLPKSANLKTCKTLKNYNLGLNYFKYRKSCSVIDHGVVGGFRLYSVIYNIYQKVLDPSGIYEYNRSHEYNGLIYSEKFLQLIGYAADAIIRHNMWNIDDNEIIEKFHLEELSNSKISLNNEPLTFLLGLCDTIEPIKRFCSEKPQEILKSIDIEIIYEDKKIIWITYPLMESYLEWLDVNIKSEKIKIIL